MKNHPGFRGRGRIFPTTVGGTNKSAVKSRGGGGEVGALVYRRIFLLGDETREFRERGENVVWEEGML